LATTPSLFPAAHAAGAPPAAALGPIGVVMSGAGEVDPHHN
jgi:hypothetical protein